MSHISDMDGMDDLDWADDFEEALYDALWRERVLHFSPGDSNAPLFDDDFLNEEELYELALAYDISMSEDGDNVTWEEYLRDQAESYRD